MGRACVMHGRWEIYKILIENLKGRACSYELGIKWEDNIRLDHREVGWDGVDWICLFQEWDQWWTVENMVMNLWVS